MDDLMAKLLKAYVDQKRGELQELINYGKSPEMMQSEARYYPGRFSSSISDSGYALTSGDFEKFQQQPSQKYDRLRDRFYGDNITGETDELGAIIKKMSGGY